MTAEGFFAATPDASRRLSGKADALSA